MTMHLLLVRSLAASSAQANVTNQPVEVFAGVAVNGAGGAVYDKGGGAGAGGWSFRCAAALSSAFAGTCAGYAAATSHASFIERLR